MKDKLFLAWLHERLELRHGEDHDIDYMSKLRSIIQVIPPDQETPNMGYPIDGHLKEGEKKAHLALRMLDELEGYIFTDIPKTDEQNTEAQGLLLNLRRFLFA